MTAMFRTGVPLKPQRQDEMLMVVAQLLLRPDTSEQIEQGILMEGAGVSIA